MTLIKIKQELKSKADPKKAKDLARFFKTGKGEYGEGDVFMGVKVSDQHKIARKYKESDLLIIQKLLESKIHEHRLTALLILTYKFPKLDESDRKKVISFYLKNTNHINNWDLVDLSAPKLLGEYLLDKPNDRKILYKLSKSKDLWERRIAILSTFPFIKKNKEFEDTLKISEILMNDDHDLIHKGVGWMLREIGKINQEKEEKFLKKHFKSMPRTMLRYAIEKFDEKKRKFYMQKL